MAGDMLGQTPELGTERFETRIAIHQPILQAVVDLLDAAGKTLRGELVAAPGQVESFLDQGAEGVQDFLLVSRSGVGHFLGTAEQMGVALSLGVLEALVGLATIDDQIAIEVRTENFRGDVGAACFVAGADGVDGEVFIAENPQPGIESVDSPAGLVGVHDLAAAQGLDEQVIGGPGQLGEALFGADEGGRASRQAAVGFEEVADLAIGDAETMFEFAGHGENNGTEGIAGGTGGVGILFGMATLAPLPTARTEAGFDVELSDDRYDGGQIGLVLDDDFGIDQGDFALRTKPTRHVDGTVDVFRRGGGP